MNLLTVVLSEQIIRAICLTLVYSLYWGVLAGALAGAVLLLTKKMRSAVRYCLLVGIMGLFALSAFITFFQQLPGSPAPFVSTVLPVSGAGPSSVSLSSTTIGGPMRIVNGLFLFCNEYSAYIVLLWFLIIILRCGRMVIDLRKVHLLTKHQVTAPGDFWSDRVASLCERLRIGVPVRLLQSSLVRVPVTMGHLKPIILVPLGILTAMSQDQVEAVLLHELAHIRRKDYLVNILQRYIEILFFFNPALLWISSLIKEERENCCDDLVISQTDNRGEYINTLVAFQEFSFGLSAIVPAFTGQKGPLLARVKRILYNKNKTLDGREKLLLIGAVAVAGFFFLSSLKDRDRVPIETPAYVARLGEMLIAEPFRSDTVPAGRPAKRTTARPIIEDTAGRPIAAETAASPEQAQAKARLEQAQVKAMLEEAQAKVLSEKAQLNALLEKAQMDRLLEKTQANTKLEHEQVESLLGQAQAEAQAQAQAQVNGSLKKLQAEAMSEKTQANAKRAREQVEHLLEQAGEHRENSLDRYIDPIIEDLIQDKVIDKSESTNFSFELNNDGLTVDNTRQPEGMSRKYKEKYIKKPNDYFRYSITGRNHRSVSVSVN